MSIYCKLCGITQVEDAELALAAGADAIGLVFYQRSHRYISINEAVEIANAVYGKLDVVALFANPEMAEVEQVLDVVPIDILQFHGDEPAEFCTRFARPYWKAVRVQQCDDIIMAMANYPQAQAILLDAYVADKLGGSGERFNWSLIPHDHDKKIILAGGLTPDNIAKAVSQVRPWGVDVSSGVELTPGKKDPKKIQQFLMRLRDAEASHT